MEKYYTAKTSDDLYFEHHGILGQKWGKKNGPPYPLGASDHSSSEKKAGWKASLNKSSNNPKTIKGDTPRIKKLNDEQRAKVKKIAKAGAVATGIALATYGTYKLKDLNSISIAGEAAVRGLNRMEKASRTTVKIAQKGVKEFGKKTVEGIPKGMGMAGDKIGKAAGFTVMALATKEVMDTVLGENLYKIVADTYNANNKKDRINFNKRRYDEDED